MNWIRVNVGISSTNKFQLTVYYHDVSALPKTYVEEFAKLLEESQWDWQRYSHWDSLNKSFLEAEQKIKNELKEKLDVVLFGVYKVQSYELEYQSTYFSYGIGNSKEDWNVAIGVPNGRNSKEQSS